jgi:hypothetical protein
MPTYAPSWEQTSPSTPPVHMGGGDFDTKGECGSRSSCSPGGVGAATGCKGNVIPSDLGKQNPGGGGEGGSNILRKACLQEMNIFEGLYFN